MDVLCEELDFFQSVRGVLDVGVSLLKFVESVDHGQVSEHVIGDDGEDDFAHCIIGE